jgi:hypothetical protein
LNKWISSSKSKSLQAVDIIEGGSPNDFVVNAKILLSEVVEFPTFDKISHNSI